MCVSCKTNKSDFPSTALNQPPHKRTHFLILLVFHFLNPSIYLLLHFSLTSKINYLPIYFFLSHVQWPRWRRRGGLQDWRSAHCSFHGGFWYWRLLRRCKDLSTRTLEARRGRKAPATRRAIRCPELEFYCRKASRKIRYDHNRDVRIS